MLKVLIIVAAVLFVLSIGIWLTNRFMRKVDLAARVWCWRCRGFSWEEAGARTGCSVDQFKEFEKRDGLFRVIVERYAREKLGFPNDFTRGQE